MKLPTGLFFLADIAFCFQTVLADDANGGPYKPTNRGPYKPTIHGRGSRKSCKCFPDQPCWPSNKEWSALNKTISGRLIKTVPVASVCYAGPNHDAAACEAVNANWSKSQFHLELPESIDAPDRANASCLPTLNPNEGTCQIGYYPWYVVNATSDTDVSEGIKFAKKHNIRLVVKATGHDFVGRSTGYGSLSIWTRHITGSKFSGSYTLKGCKKPRIVKHKVGTFGAGVVWSEGYAAAQTQNLTLSGGTVGTISVAGGHPQGGGHGYLSHEFGLAADQPVEFEAVLASGQIITANECQHSDIYWALRGGGPGTYAVVTKTTVKAYPNYPLMASVLNVTMTNPHTDGKLPKKMHELVIYLYSQIPRLMDGGMAGYSYLFPNGQFLWIMPQVQSGKHKQTVEQLMAPIVEELNLPEWKDTFTSAIVNYPVPDVGSLVHSGSSSSANEAGGSSGSSSSRLLPRSILEDPNVFGPLLTKIFPDADETGGYSILIGHHIADGQVAENADVDNAVLPAWRRANTHLLSARLRAVASPEGKLRDMWVATNVIGKAFREVDPKGGAYMNECDYNEPNWKQSFFGKNWDRLSRIKQRYDPDDVFWCYHCVGSEDWAETDGKLCKIRD